MATPRPTDPDIETLVESIRARLLRAPDRAGALRYVHFALDAWNGEALAPWEGSMTTRAARAARAEDRRREQERCPDCQQRKQRFAAAFDRLARRGMFGPCPAHPVIIYESTPPESTTTPEQTLAEVGISTKRQARYQRRLSS